MSYCLNPSCRKRENLDDEKSCQGCGSNLLLKDRYRPIRSIGQGSFGRTFLAVDEDMPSRPFCVIKQFFYQGKDFEKAEELFRQEAVQLEALGKQHSQIPELMAHFELDSGLYLVEEFIEGKDLLEEVKEQGAFEETKITQLLNDLLAVLQFIHKNRVIHRDIKPENIIRRQVDDKLVLVDFGVSKFATETALGRTGTVIGTKGYAAPEQSQGKARFSSDLYSLGATCFYLLTAIDPSRVFFQWCDWQKYLRIHLSKKDISDQLKLILTKLLNPDINERYQSAQEVLQDLKLKQSQATNKSLLVIPTVAPQFPTESWKCVHTLTGHRWSICTLAVSPNGRILASGSTDHSLKIWDLSSLEMYELCVEKGDVYSVAFSLDNQTLASSSLTIKLWNVGTKELLHTFSSHQKWISSVAFSPDSYILASGSGDLTVKLWHFQGKNLLSTFFGHSKPVCYVAISTDGYALISASESEVIIRNLNTKEIQHTITENLTSIVINPNRKSFAIVNENKIIKLFDIGSGKILFTISNDSKNLESVALSPNGYTLACGSWDKVIKIWDTRSGDLVHILSGHSTSICSLTFSSDGQMLASGDRGGAIKIWRIST